MKTISHSVLVFATFAGFTVASAQAAVAPDGNADSSNLSGQSVSQCQPAMQVCSITFTSTKSGSTYTVTGVVTVVQTSFPQSGVQGASVNVTWKRPNATTATQSAVTSSSGAASFSTTGTSGTYTLTVNNVSKTSYTFDAADSILSKSVIK